MVEVKKRLRGGTDMFRRKYERLITDLDRFYTEKEAFDTKDFIDNIEDFIIYLKEMDDDVLSKIDYIHASDLVSVRDICNSNKKDKELIIREYAAFLFHYYSLYTKIENGSDEWAEKANAIDEHIENYFLEQKIYSTITHYKNLLVEEEQSEFENILELLSNQLKRYDTNLYHCQKILEFFEKYYPDKIFPADTFFLNNYLGNTVDLMILTITKLYLDACDINKRKNCGMKYLQSFIGIKVSDKSNIKDILKDASVKIKDVVAIAKKLEPVRDKLIAHFDISEMETAQNIKMHIDEFIRIYELSCEILELMSLGYFEYKDVFSQKMIQSNGFKFFICQNPWCHNPNPYYESDLDKYLKMIKANFNSCMKLNNEKP